MSLVSPYGIGGTYAVKGKTTLVSRLAMSPGGNAVSQALVIENIPLILARLRQTTNTGVGLGATIELQGMVRITNASTPKWEAIQTVVALPGGSPMFPFSPDGFMFPFSQVRFSMTASAAAVGLTLVEFTLAATA